MRKQCWKSYITLVSLQGFSYSIPELRRYTYSHNNQESSEKTSEVDNATAAALHEIIIVGCAAAKPVWKGCDYVGCYHEERKVVLP
jgi:hypothetical protein